MSSNHRSVTWTCLLTSLILWVTSPPAAADQGDVDTTFGNDGEVSLSLGQHSDFISAMASDGELTYAAGWLAQSQYNSSISGFLLRLRADGSLDGDFGTGGVGQLLPGYREQKDVLVQSDGMVLVGGIDHSDQNSETMYLARYSADGSLDSSFGTAGEVNLGQGGSWWFDTATAPHDKVVIVGGTYIDSMYHMKVVRLNEDGSFDASFGSSGVVTTACGDGQVGATAVKVMTDGSLAVAGGTHPVVSPAQACLVRLTSDGKLDPSFGNAGKVVVYGRTFADMTMRPDGGFVVSGVISNGSTWGTHVSGYTSSGAVDTGFGNKGRITLDSVGLGDTVLQPDGKVLLLGSVGNSRPALWRFTSDGRGDTDYLTGFYPPAASPGPIYLEGSDDGGSLSLRSLAHTPAGVVVGGDRAQPGGQNHAYLTRVTTTGLRPDPVAARLAVSRTTTTPGEPLTLDASGSTTTSGFKTFQWDLDGNGTFETDSGGTPTTSATWDSEGDHHASVQVTSGSGLTDRASIGIFVTPGPPPGNVGVSINNGSSYTRDKDVTLRLVWPKGATAVAVANDGGFGDPTTYPLGTKIAWTLDNSVKGKFTKVVYVRFTGPGADANRNYSDDIILDTDPPTIEAASASTTGTKAAELSGLAARSPKRTTYRVKVRAKDRLSGIRKVRVAGAQGGPQRILKYRAGSLRVVLPVAKHLKIKVRDGAGNWSRLRLVRVRQ